MTLSNAGSSALTSSRSILKSLIEMPELACTIQALPAQSFTAIIRKVGLEDAGELLALATTEQLIRVFDEDLFVNARAGEQEVFDGKRFATWLEVLLEAGDEAAARRIAELDEDFVAHALSTFVLVLDQGALRERMDDAEADDVRQADKALESALTEEIDGYILVAKQYAGWDAALALLLALDRNHRALLERLLDRLAAVSRDCLNDLDDLTTALTEGASLAEDVEAAREERRSKQGYVEPRAARAFLKLAQHPQPTQHLSTNARDPLTMAYFRDLERHRHPMTGAHENDPREGVRALPPPFQRGLAEAGLPLTLHEPSESGDPTRPLVEALRKLSEADPEVFEERMEELVYLANVLVAGADLDGLRMRSKEAAEAVLATLCFGVLIEACERGQATPAEWAQLTQQDLIEIVRTCQMDILFRRASSALAAGSAPRAPAAKTRGLLCSSEELAMALAP